MSGPLTGKRVVNTRAAHQAGALDALLQAEGAVSVPFPCISIEPVADPAELDAALQSAVNGAYDWVLFTSVNTAHAVGARLRALGSVNWASAPCRVAAVGTATAAAVERAIGRRVDLIPAEQLAAALAAALPLRAGERVLIPASSKARPELAEGLRARGAIVTVVTAYETVAAAPEGDIGALIGSVDALTFASPSAVTGFSERLAASRREPDVLDGLVVACIGPTTLAAARAHRFPSPLMARDQSLGGLIQLLKTAFAARNEQEAIKAR